jgi:hypothetical protein
MMVFENTGEAAFAAAYIEHAAGLNVTEEPED